MLRIDKEYLESCRKKANTDDSYELLSFTLCRVVLDVENIQMDLKRVKEYLHYLNDNCDVSIEDVYFVTLFQEIIPNDESGLFEDIRTVVKRVNKSTDAVVFSIATRR